VVHKSPKFLKKSPEIERVKREGHRFQTAFFNLVSCPSDESQARVGIIVGKRLGNAVLRNRAKRLFRELSRQCGQRLVPHQAFLVFPRRKALSVAFRQLQEAWIAALIHEGLLQSES
jgi:ribonuclease P protein component